MVQVEALGVGGVQLLTFILMFVCVLALQQLPLSTCSVLAWVRPSLLCAIELRDSFHRQVQYPGC